MHAKPTYAQIAMDSTCFRLKLNDDDLLIECTIDKQRQLYDECDQERNVMIKDTSHIHI